MNEKRKETLHNIDKILSKWKKGEIAENRALDDIYDETSSLEEWEDEERRISFQRELDKTAITIKSKVKYMGKLELNPIEGMEKDDE